jgi:ActR/RegA family two-component response regulator
MPDAIETNTAPTRRARRTPEQMIADLQAQLAMVKARVEMEKASTPPVSTPRRVRPAVATKPAESPVPTTAMPASLDARIEARVQAFTVDLVALIKRATLEAIQGAVDDLGSGTPDRARELVPEPPPYVVTPARRPRSRSPTVPNAAPVSFLAYERMAIQRALAESNGNLVAAAKLLGVGKSTMYRRTRAVGITAQDEPIAAAPDDPVLAAGEPVSFEAYEKAALVRALDECGGNRLAAARLLKVGKSTLYRMAVKHRVG